MLNQLSVDHMLDCMKNLKCQNFPFLQDRMETENKISNDPIIFIS